ncbi:MAG: NDP-sugar synthase [Acidobacteria bacterium]|nr:NDP-sugar synthase [Acidobacteriota bacterium]MCA1636943.1 NDP-sugar synthase [Acidobacteriota bacterium]
MKAMILAAGFGTRLFPLTIDRTKPAIPFLGKPLVGYVAEYVAKFGFREVVVNLHHQPDSVIKALGDGSKFGVKIHYTLEEPNILGTAGALDKARELLEDDTFLIINGKIITDIDISKAIETHKKSGALATMVLMENKKREKFTIVETQSNLVTGFGDFPENSSHRLLVGSQKEIQNPLMFTGIHILEPRVFEYIPRGVYSDIVPIFYRPAIRKGEKIVAHVTEGNWFELSTISRYLDISLEMMNGRKDRVFAGERVDISSKAVAKDSVIWDDVTIEGEAKINRTIVADGVKIPRGGNFVNVAIVRADMLKNAEMPEKALKGYFAGENYIVPLNQ